MFDWLSIPEYAEAREREETARDAAFVLEHDDICGVPVKPLSLRHFTLLVAIGSPFVCAGELTATEAARFIWIVSAVRCRNDTAQARDRFLKSIRGLNFVHACQGISRYLDEAFQDSPGGGSSNRPLSTSFAAVLVDMIAREYGWRESDILDMPLRRLFQYLRCIRHHHDPDAVFVNPSDAVRRRWVKENVKKN